MSPDLYAAIVLESLKLANKIWDDTPPEKRTENMERWYAFWDRFADLFDGPD